MGWLGGIVVARVNRLTHWQCPGIPINYIYWAGDAPGYPEQKGMPHTLEWGDFAHLIQKHVVRCDWCARALSEEEISEEGSAILMTEHSALFEPQKWICEPCQREEMHQIDREQGESDLHAMWMEEKYGYLRDEQ